MLEELGIKRRKSGDGIPEEAEADFDDDIGMLMPVTEDGEEVEIDETEFNHNAGRKMNRDKLPTKRRERRRRNKRRRNKKEINEKQEA